MIVDFRIIGTGERFFPGGYEGLPPFMARYKDSMTSIGSRSSPSMPFSRT